MVQDTKPVRCFMIKLSATYFDFNGTASGVQQNVQVVMLFSYRVLTILTMLECEKQVPPCEILVLHINLQSTVENTGY